MASGGGNRRSAKSPSDVLTRTKSGMNRAGQRAKSVVSARFIETAQRPTSRRLANTRRKLPSPEFRFLLANEETPGRRDDEERNRRGEPRATELAPRTEGVRLALFKRFVDAEGSLFESVRLGEVAALQKLSGLAAPVLVSVAFPGPVEARMERFQGSGSFLPPSAIRSSFETLARTRPSGTSPCGSCERGANPSDLPPARSGARMLGVSAGCSPS
jgi:hypothetical protein